MFRSSFFYLNALKIFRVKKGNLTRRDGKNFKNEFIKIQLFFCAIQSFFPDIPFGPSHL